ncbi:MAG: ribosome biogenesis GTPase YlqF [Bacillota bacterium]|jgi:ribosome biogenesis GTPase A
MGLSWFPGHMAKAVGEIRQNMKLIDVVIEILDARAPRATANPYLDEALGSKPRVLVLNKADLADPRATQAWLNVFGEESAAVVQADCQKGAGVKEAIGLAEKAARSIGRNGRSERRRRRFRTVVVGIPNVGKSSFINRAARRSGAKTGDRPGVTRAKQWIVVGPSLEMLDTPGIMPPRVDDPAVWFALAAVGCIDDNLLDMESLSQSLISRLGELGAAEFRERYGVPDDMADPHLVLEHVSLKRGCLKSGGEADTERGASLIIRDFRSGKLGRVTLELP